MDTMRGGIVTALNVLYLEALRAAERLAEALGDKVVRVHCTKKATKLAAAIQARLWDAARGAYPDCWVDGRPNEIISEPTNALAVLHLEKSNSARAQRLRQLLTREASQRVIRSSPFFMPVVLRALLRLNQADHAWQIVQERYRPILAAGSATTWEYWDLFHQDVNGRVSVHSGSHAWGAGPLILFFEGFAGVRSLEPGFKKFALTPHLGSFDQLTFATPTPAGVIHGECRREAAKVQVEFTVPAGATAVVKSRTFSPGKHRAEIAAP